MRSRSRRHVLVVDTIRTGQPPAQFADRDRLPRTLRNSAEGQYETSGGHKTHLVWFQDQAWFACHQGEGTRSRPQPKVSLNESEQRTLKRKKNSKRKKEMKSQQVYVKTDQLERFSIWGRVRTNTAF
jgi:hypothetical protein